MDAEAPLPETERQCCSKCNDPLEWSECGMCGGDGFFDGFEEDPNWYQPGEYVDCSQCGGQGGWLCCANPKCPPET